MSALFSDIRYALRTMARTPGFTAVALLMIAVGTGANAAMFSVIDAVMVRSPFRDPDRIALVQVVQHGRGPTAAVSLAQYRSLVESAPVFEAVGAIGGGQRPIAAGLGDTRRLNAECVTAGMFQVLGVTPLMGRTFTAEEDRAGGPTGVVISYAFWQDVFGGRSDALGRVLTLNGIPATIVGVMPRRFLGPYSRNNNDAWLPLGPALGGASPAGCQARAVVNVLTRIRPGVALETAAAQATASAGIDRLPDFSGRTGARLNLISIDEQTFYELRTPMFTLLGAVGLVLLIACANVANLQLERVFGRRRELAVRMAMGATRGRVVRQTLTENLLLYALGGAAGSLLAFWMLRLIVGLLPATVPHLNEIDVNARVLASTLGMSALAGLAVGLVPALQATSPSLVDDLRASSRSSTVRGAWVRGALVVSQIALSLTLLVGAALMVRTFLTLMPSAPGFNATDKLTAVIRLQGPASSAPGVFFEKFFDRLRTIPGVLSVSGSTYLPMSGTVNQVTAVTETGTTNVWKGVVTPNYFDEMQIAIARGRGFTARDDGSAPAVAIVNEAMVRKAWPAGVDPLGATVAVENADGTRAVRQVVGVIRDTRSLGVDLKARPELYVPFAQSPDPWLNVIIRTRDVRDPRLPVAVRAAAAAIDASQVVDRFAPMQDMLDSRVATPRFGAWLLGIFAAMAVLLAAVGLAASVAWWVAERTREIGVRMALGAQTGDVTRMFLRQGLLLTTAGLLLGLGAAAASTRLLQSWLYGVTPLDRAVFAGSAVAMLGIAALASYIPARRAARVDPLIALRSE